MLLCCNVVSRRRFWSRFVATMWLCCGGKRRYTEVYEGIRRYTKVYEAIRRHTKVYESILVITLLIRRTVNTVTVMS